MDKRLNTPLILGLLLIPYGILFRFYFFKDTNIRAVNNFTELLRQSFLIAALLLFLGTIWSASPRPMQAKTRPASLVGAWWGSFMLGILFAMGLAIYVNPHGRFPGKRFPSISPNARSIKIELYGKMKTAPDIVVLGSSRAFTLSPGHLEDRVGYRAFNMAVEGGRPGDYTVELNYMLKSDTAPRLLVMEASQESFTDVYFESDLQPLALIPYMPIEMAAPVADSSLRDILGLRSLSDSAYILTLPDVQNPLGTWTFEQDGLGIRKPLTHVQYIKLLDLTIHTYESEMQCKDFDPTAKKEFEATIALAQENDIGIVLYISPMHAAFYRAAYENNPAAFEFCRVMLRTYLWSLAESNPNVFFRDLSDYRAVNDLEEDGFYDAIHLKATAAGLVVDALLPEIESALDWSLHGTVKAAP